jgi:hypothetical protein
MSGRRLDPATAARLAKVLGRLGSDFDAERATAARMADQLVRDAGLSWQDVLGLADAADAAPAACRDLARWLLSRLRNPSEKERDFLATMAASPRKPTEKQLRWLEGLARRVRTEGAR